MSKPNSNKPVRPYKDFPLTPHASGQWVKKFRGKTFYFGHDWKAALELYQQQLPNLQAGLGMIEESAGGLTLKQLCNAYLAKLEARVRTGERSELHFNDMLEAAQKLCDILGKTRQVESLRPPHFERLRAKLAEGVSLNTLKSRIVRSRILLNHAAKAELIEGRIRYGSALDLPDAKSLARERNQNRETHGARLFTPDELQRILRAAESDLRAMVLLGVNCGFGNQDVMDLRPTHVELEHGHVTMARRKTGVGRACPLWPETIEALKPHCQAGEVKVFPGVTSDGLSVRFRRLLRSLEIYRPGLSFYALRHTTQTIGDESGEFLATKAIMGHVDGSMSGQYREYVSMDRKREVTEYIRTWLFGDVGGDGGKKQPTLRIVG